MTTPQPAHRAPRPRGGLRRMFDRLSSPTAQLEVDDIRQASAQLGGTPIREVHDRDLAEVCGTVRSVSVRPRAGQVPALVVELDDGSQTMRLVWLGRRHIAGIEPGCYLRAKGRVCVKSGARLMYNPSYELRGGPH